MDETLFCWVLLLFIIIYRQLTKWNWVQKLLHCFGPLAPWFQWYSLLLLGLGALLLRSLYDIILFDYLKGHFLDPEVVSAQLNATLPSSVTEEEKAALEMSPVLRIISLSAPLAGLLAFLVVVGHVISNVSFGHTLQLEADDDHAKTPWAPVERQNLVLLVLAMPAVFIVMSVRAEIRMWAVMTGSAWLPYKDQNPATTSWDHVKQLQLSTYTTDLELACTFQYYTVWSFGRLCATYLLRAPAEYRKALLHAGLQGVHLYVIIGALRSIVDFAIAVLSETENKEQNAYLIALLQDKVLTFIGPVFLVGTLLCVYNMFIIANMQDVTSHLDKASMKFQATRVLLLISQIQLQVLVGITAGSSLQLQLAKMPAPLNEISDHLHLSVPRAKLLHSALLSFECLLVVLFNRYAWRSKRQYFVADDDEAAQQGYQPVGDGRA